MNVEVNLNIKTETVTKKAHEAGVLAMRDTVVAISSDSISNSPVLTGNNRRSIAAECSELGLAASGGEGGAERVVDDTKIEGAVYSTSGYGGYLEVGHHTKSGSFVSGRPYFKPALDKEFTLDKYTARMKRHFNA